MVDTTGSSSFGAAPIAIAAALTLSACDSGSSGGMTGATTQSPATATPAAAVAPVGITQVQASRFLAQATMGATRSEISKVQSLGYEGWLNSQMSMPRAITHLDWMVGNSANTAITFDNSMWRQLISEPDQLRQRVGMALLEIMVVGFAGVDLSWRQYAMAAYVDILLDNAFGNYRTLLEKISTNAAMGSFLTFLNNRKANPTTGAQPDENYARELMQLFTIGVYKLNIDGTRQLSGGLPIETYSQTDVSQLAQVFTGLVLDTTDTTTPERYKRPLVANASLHETGASSFLGTTVPAGTATMDAIGIALDGIFANPNVPPFISKQLIQRLVTSNPSPAYVGRVAAVFADNGSGVRGDLKAVIKAILLDSEARGDVALTATTTGKLREPVMRFTAWARACEVTSPSNVWAIGDTTYSIGQALGRSGSVFNFFRPGYSPPGTAITNAGLVAPEFQLVSEVWTVAYVNYMTYVIDKGVADLTPDYSNLIAIASDAQALTDNVNMLLAAGQLGASAVSTIRSAVASVSASNTTQRVQIALVLTLAAPEFLTIK
ncbi:DUF1800 domain-containing protein [Sphingomonas sp. AOB5]|uniref:DUF1800 domain-containing protein n=1 Tax=Sphingomonas sp. AOB5 TaxID=3034017 RepID=UPI0023F70EC6|nr:DUF1800 domain-containing protein [Sphingomonas sp. AOB5]MDF7774325.1 DUF1800 domain-containing protein [Sphingomonas sp. AOB5]